MAWDQEVEEESHVDILSAVVVTSQTNQNSVLIDRRVSCAFAIKTDI
jgi:hypothetical protein